MRSQGLNASQIVTSLPTPPLMRLLFKTTAFAWVWLPVRLYLAYVWIQAGVGKLSNPAWMDGTALKGFWTGAVAIPDQGPPRIAFDWYRAFIAFMLNSGSYTWFAKLVAFGELLVGVGLLVGAVVGICAAFGIFMNWNYIMAGAASTNGMLLVLGVLLIVAWRVAGWYGLDRFILPRVGMYVLPRQEPPATLARSSS